MIKVEKIKDLVLKNYIKSNTDKNSLSEEDYIKNAIDISIKFSKNLVEFENNVKKLGVSIDNYFSNKHLMNKLSYKTSRINCGISEDRLGEYYSLNNIVNMINNKKRER